MRKYLRGDIAPRVHKLLHHFVEDHGVHHLSSIGVDGELLVLQPRPPTDPAKPAHCLEFSPKGPLRGPWVFGFAYSQVGLLPPSLSERHAITYRRSPSRNMPMLELFMPGIAKYFSPRPT